MSLSDAVWRRATKSAEHGGNCVEVVSAADIVALRDRKDPDGPKLMVNRDDFKRLAESIKDL